MDTTNVRDSVRRAARRAAKAALMADDAAVRTYTLKPSYENAVAMMAAHEAADAAYQSALSSLATEGGAK